MRVLGGAWTAHVIWYLREGERCFTELQLDIGKVSAKMLTNCLRRLEREGIILRLTRATISADCLVSPYARRAGALHGPRQCHRCRTAAQALELMDQ